jgi:hypothetical protein
MFGFKVSSSLMTLAIGFLLQGCGAAPSSAAPTEEERRQTAQQEIAELQQLYAHATDLIAADAAAYEAEVRSTYLKIFTEDARIGVGDQLVLLGPLAWLEFVKTSANSMQSTQHLIGNQVVEIQRLPSPEGIGGEASMTSALHATLVGADGELSTVEGTYFATATHTPESGWQLTEMKLEAVAAETPDS